MSRKKRTLFGTRPRTHVDPDAPTHPEIETSETPSSPDEPFGLDDIPTMPLSLGDFRPLDVEPVAAAATEPVPPLAPGDALLGTRIGQWSIKEVIGDSQGCVLVRARHHQSKRIRATLKVLVDDQPGTRQRLVREGEILFPLEHTSIVGVRNVMMAHDPAYLEFTQLRGEPLDALLERRQSLFMAETLDLAEQLLAVLVYLHDKQVFHMDIQPANIMVRPDGVITLIGFSHAIELGRLNGAEPGLPPCLAHIPPEWPDRDAPAHADLYAVGVLLYRLLTGARPFDAPDEGGPLTAALVMHRKDQVPFLDPGARFQEDLRSVVRQLTNREPAGRLSVAEDALSRLQSVERSYAS